MTEISPLTGLRRRADNLQPASVAHGDPSGLKNAVTGASLGRTEVYIWRISAQVLRRNLAGLPDPAQYREKMEPAVRLSRGRAELRGAIPTGEKDRTWLNSAESRRSRRATAGRKGQSLMSLRGESRSGVEGGSIRLPTDGILSDSHGGRYAGHR